MKQKYPSVETNIKVDFDQMESKHIISAAVNEQDPLALMVVHKFLQILGVETGNLALET